MKQQLSDYGIVLDHIPIKCDNTSATNLSKNPVLHSRTKHIEIRHHFLRDHVLKGDCVLEFVDTKNQLADIFTKPLPKDSFYTIRRELRLLDASDLDKLFVLWWLMTYLIHMPLLWFVDDLLSYLIFISFSFFVCMNTFLVPISYFLFLSRVFGYFLKLY